MINKFYIYRYLIFENNYLITNNYDYFNLYDII